MSEEIFVNKESIENWEFEGHFIYCHFQSFIEWLVNRQSEPSYRLIEQLNSITSCQRSELQDLCLLLNAEWIYANLSSSFPSSLKEGIYIYYFLQVINKNDSDSQISVYWEK